MEKIKIIIKFLIAKIINSLRPQYKIPEYYLQRHIKISSQQYKELEISISNNYHTGWRAKENYSLSSYQKDLEDHLYNRLELDRKYIIPWLDSVKKLDGASVLEIGCGTGSSTVALAEQGAIVYGIDIDEGAIKVAIDRCRIYGVDSKLFVINSKYIDKYFNKENFDYILFFASLEHMTISERIESLTKAWEILKKDGILGIIETPNRLWFYDNHTSLLPFFHWLPDELAFRYSCFSKRENFSQRYKVLSDENMETFLRQGRGFSYHEIELAIGPIANLNVVSSLFEFKKKHGIGKYIKNENKYKNILVNVYPDIPEAFFDKELNLLIKKV